MHSYENEPIVVQREVKAVTIPAGVEVNLKLASVGYITQALGGSFTVYIDGNLFRIAGKDADAIGKTAATPPEVPPAPAVPYKVSPDKINPFGYHPSLLVELIPLK